MENRLDNCYFGTSGLLLPVPNKLYYPPEFQERSRLHYYSSLMNSIEVNSSFYKLPRSATLAKWADEVPADFRFTFKVSREITHHKDLAFSPTVLDGFMAAVSAVGQKAGCLLVQFPASIRIGQIRQLEVLMKALRERDRAEHWNIALEFRHQSWYTAELYELLDRYQVGMVLHDKAGATPMVDRNPSFCYLRMHGPDGDYRGSYDDGMLHEYASYVAAWLSENKEVYVYFNNTMGSANANLDRMREIVMVGRGH